MDAFAPATFPLGVQDSLRMNNSCRRPPKDGSFPPETSSPSDQTLQDRGRPGAATARPFHPRRSGGGTLRLSGQFLELTGTVPRQTPLAATGLATAASGTPVSSAAVSSSAASGTVVPGMVASGAAALQLSVPKRLVRAAVRRNTVKRVLREAWRLAPDAALLQSADRVWRFRLKAHPLGSLAAKSQYARAQMRLQARKAGTPGSAASQSASLPSFADIKRQLRAEADQLLADAARRLKNFRNSPAGSSSSRSRA